MLGRKSLYFGLAMLVCAGLFAGLAQRLWRAESASKRDDSDAWREEPPPRNARPGVAYVGDARCRACHRAISDQYRRHPMGQSLGPLADVAALESFDPKAHVAFTAAGLHYEVLGSKDRMVHRETLRDAQGKPMASREAEIQYTLGSGARGRSYLINLDDQSFLSPIAWYTQGKRWDLSPGYAKTNFHFERPVKVDCLFCHSNRVEPAANTANRYEKPLFRGYAIGCERCHGPGEIHVREQEIGEADPATSIVNPKRLPPVLRDSVCEQCHLLGEARVPRQGREEFDYRPGRPLHEFLAVFIKARLSTSEEHAVSHVEQMVESKCFRKSKGKLGCISCHDPHSLPEPAGRAAFFRARCLGCHGEAGPECSLAPGARMAKNQDDCASCHMPRFAASDVAHTAITDHRIVRRPDQSQPRRDPVALLPWQSPLEHFHEKLLPPGQLLKRELAIAYVQSGMAYALALTHLDECLGRQPDDVPVLKAKGIALAHLGSAGEALRTFERILSLVPDHENALAMAGSLAAQLDKLDRAEDYWHRVIKVNPHFSNHYLELARVLFRRERWDEAAREARAALDLNPTRHEARRILLVCYLRLGDREKARSEWQVYQEFKPPDLEQVRTLMNEGR
jgi:predicted CXXCH cytochrome family protein